MAMKIATKINSIGGGSNLRGKLSGRLPGGSEAGLDSLEAMQMLQPSFKAAFQGLEGMF